MGKAKRHPTNSVKCWVTLHSLHPTRLCDRSGFVVRRLGEAKRNPTKPGEMCGDIALGPPNKVMRSLWVRSS
ncbi:hypothetical protein NIES39_C05450 [Arthrospira platensis NIES-39]|nr:hypothetical protein NIES39_C05450 [Arthrospira platensis NIES-39]